METLIACLKNGIILLPSIQCTQHRNMKVIYPSRRCKNNNRQRRRTERLNHERSCQVWMNFCVCTYISFSLPTHNGCVMKQNKCSYSIPNELCLTLMNIIAVQQSTWGRSVKMNYNCWLLNWIIYHSMSHRDILSKYLQSSTSLKLFNIEINVTSKRWTRCFWMYNEINEINVTHFQQ